MKLQQSISLSSIYRREEDFSTDLANTLDALEVGKFEDAETESSVGTRRADIVGVGVDGYSLLKTSSVGQPGITGAGLKPMRD